MEPDTGISSGLERRLSRLAAGPGVPVGVDTAVLRQAEVVLRRRRGVALWFGGWQRLAAAAVVGVVLGVGALSVREGGRKVDMVDALRAAREGAPAAQVRRIESAAVMLKPGARRGGAM